MFRIIPQRLCCSFRSRVPSLDSRNAFSNGCGRFQGKSAWNGFRYDYSKARADRQRRFHHDRNSSNNRSNGRPFGFFFLQAGVWSSMQYHLGLKKDDVEDRPIKEKIVTAAGYCREQKFDAALAELHDALFMAEQGNNENAINYCIDMMANIYYFTGRYDEAESSFGTLIQRIINSGSIDGVPALSSPAVVELSLKLADVYALKGDHEKAVSGFEFCVETQKANLEKAIAEEKMQNIRIPGVKRHDVAMDPETTDPFALYGLVLETYARYLARKGRIEDSQMYINRALEMAYEIYGALHPHTLAVMNNFAIVCLQQRRYDIAERYLKDVVKRAPMMDDGGEHVAGYYTNYAEALWHLGRQEEALDYAKRAANVAMDKSVSDETKDRTKRYLSSMETDLRSGKRKGT